MRLEYSETPTYISNDDLIADMKNVANFLSVQVLTAADYDEHGKYHSRTISKRFGTWNKALEIAGLQIANKFYSENELFENLALVWMRLGKQPSKRDLALVGSPISYKAYERRFGKWSLAVKAFVEYFNNLQDNQSSPQEVLQPNKPVHQSSRDINLRTRYLVLRRDNYSCCICGASPAKDPSVELHVDHITPWSKGGSTELYNLQTLCRDCNLGKGNLSE